MRYQLGVDCGNLVDRNFDDAAIVSHKPVLLLLDVRDLRVDRAGEALSLEALDSTHEAAVFLRKRLKRHILIACPGFCRLPKVFFHCHAEAAKLAQHTDPAGLS